jgi:DNA repair protein SbcC/Rad50
MILAAIEIENYKQYAGTHHIEFPQQGMVAITGPNGAGKTTLFEAIEWCLYAPRTIPLPTIPPHGGIGKSVVRVTLEDPQDGRRYVVERELRASGLSTRAEAYCEDEPGKPLVKGPKDVTDFVAKRLIGLPHPAFVSTFFTRQKELTFFGDLAPAKRREDVGKLLGYQAIREAYEELTKERTEAKRLADSLRSAHERESAGRDFLTEIAVAEREVDDSKSSASEAVEVAERCEQEVERSREALDYWLGLQEQDAALDRELVRIAGETAAAEGIRMGAESELRRLDQRTEERAALSRVAGQSEMLAFEVDMLDEQRARAERLKVLQEGQRGGMDRLELQAHRMRRLVEDHAEIAAGLVELTWTEADNDHPEAGAVRLLMAISGLDPEEGRRQVECLLRVQDCSRSFEAVGAELSKLRKHRDRLSAERDALLAEGDLRLIATLAEKAELQGREAERAARQARTTARSGREEAERILIGLEGRRDEASCPTCSQPLPREAASRIVRILEADVARLKHEEASAARGIAAAEQEIETARRNQAAAKERQEKLSVLDGRLADGTHRIEAAEVAHGDCLRDLEDAYAVAGVTDVPTDHEIAQARDRAERMQRLVSLATRLEEFAHQMTEARVAAEAAARAIAELGPVVYDADAHGEAQAKLATARNAVAQIAMIDKELAHRAQYESQRDEARARAADLEAARGEVTAKRAALGFDPEQLAAARGAEAAARAAAHAARTALGEARAALQVAETRLHRVIEARDRLRELAEEADRQGREADELDRMVREFAEFDRFVADRVGPLLADTTERLLGQVTDGKYDHVRFDENYGIEVYDGDEAFDLAGFSGGERDVVSLCARLAMSELVGSAALRPPRFLVLDEVFGSLDSERRAQLLGTLGSLASSGHFQQVFIISHVDDVQQSHVMDEAWTIEERDGVSHVVRPMPALAGVD